MGELEAGAAAFVLVDGERGHDPGEPVPAWPIRVAVPGEEALAAALEVGAERDERAEARGIRRARGEHDERRLVFEREPVEPRHERQGQLDLARLELERVEDDEEKRARAQEVGRGTPGLGQVGGDDEGQRREVEAEPQEILGHERGGLLRGAKTRPDEDPRGGLTAELRLADEAEDERGDTGRAEPRDFTEATRERVEAEAPDLSGGRGLAAFLGVVHEAEPERRAGPLWRYLKRCRR